VLEIVVNEPNIFHPYFSPRYRNSKQLYMHTNNVWKLGTTFNWSV